MSENDFECFARTGVNTPDTMFPSHWSHWIQLPRGATSGPASSEPVLACNFRVTDPGAGRHFENAIAQSHSTSRLPDIDDPQRSERSEEPRPVYPMHDEEVGLIEGKESGSLLIRQCTSGRSLRSTFLSLCFVPRLDGMRVDDCPN
jgi:hypothetical protein